MTEPLDKSSFLIYLPREALFNLFGYLDPVTDLPSLAITCKGVNAHIVLYFQSLWLRLRNSTHLEGPIDVSSLIGRVHRDDTLDARPFFAQLRDEFKSYEATLPKGRPPITNPDIASLQFQTATFYDSTLVRIWLKISQNNPSIPDLKTASEIRNWLDDPNNSIILSKITELDLSNQNIRLLPTEIGQFFNLKKLDISRNMLTHLPNEFAVLSQLEELCINSNQLVAFPAAICRFAQLNKLDISSNKLGSFPLGILALKNLKILNLSNTQLSSLPPDIGQLTELSDLDLSDNQLSSLPKELEALTGLKELKLENNHFSVFPDAIVNLRSLQELFLSNNNLTVIPDAIGNLSYLTRLELAQNQFSVLPLTVRRLSNLHTLKLGGNKFTSFPVVITSLKALNRLQFCNNQIISIPDTILNLTHLTSFDLHGNPLMFVPYKVLYSKVEALHTSMVIFQLREELKFQPTSSLAKLYQSILQLSQPSLLKMFQSFIQTPPSDPLVTRLYRSFSETMREDQTNKHFLSLPSADQNLIFEMVWICAGNQNTDDPQWGEHHVFEDMDRFYLSVRKAISTKLERLPQEKKNEVYGKVWELAGKPITKDWQWGEHLALDNLTRLADAMEL